MATSLGGYSVFLDELGRQREEAKTVTEVDRETFAKAKKVTHGLSDSMHVLANEPSIGLYRTQEHVTRSIPELVERKREVERLSVRVEGAVDDAVYAIDALKRMQNVPQLRRLNDAIANTIKLQESINVQRAAEKATQDLMKAARESESIVTRVDVEGEIPEDKTIGVATKEDSTEDSIDKSKKGYDILVQDDGPDPALNSLEDVQSRSRSNTAHSISGGLDARPRSNTGKSMSGLSISHEKLSAATEESQSTRSSSSPTKTTDGGKVGTSPLSKGSSDKPKKKKKKKKSDDIAPKAF